MQPSLKIHMRNKVSNPGFSPSREIKFRSVKTNSQKILPSTVTPSLKSIVIEEIPPNNSEKYITETYLPKFSSLANIPKQSKKSAHSSTESKMFPKNRSQMSTELNLPQWNAKETAFSKSQKSMSLYQKLLPKKKPDLCFTNSMDGVISKKNYQRLNISNTKFSVNQRLSTKSYDDLFSLGNISSEKKNKIKTKYLDNEQSTESLPSSSRNDGSYLSGFLNPDPNKISRSKSSKTKHSLSPNVERYRNQFSGLTSSTKKSHLPIKVDFLKTTYKKLKNNNLLDPSRKIELMLNTYEHIFVDENKKKFQNVEQTNGISKESGRSQCRMGSLELIMEDEKEDEEPEITIREINFRRSRINNQLRKEDGNGINAVANERNKASSCSEDSSTLLDVLYLQRTADQQRLREKAHGLS